MDFIASKQRAKAVASTARNPVKTPALHCLESQSLQTWGHREHHAFYVPKLHPTPFG